MRLPSKLGLLLLLLALKPACGGGGGGGGSTIPTKSFPPLPPLVAPAPTAASMPGFVPGPIALDATAAARTVDATAGRTDAQVIADLQAAMDLGGKTNIDTGGVNRTVVLSAQFVVKQSTPSPVILEGNGFLTLDGNLVTRMFDMQYLTSLHLQRIHFVRGRASQNGGAINAGTPIVNLTVLNCTFDDCQTIEGGPDRGGGAIRAWNTEHTRISRCTFNQCAGSNGGAVNSLGSRLWIIESTFTQNAAFGVGGGGNVGATGQGGIGGAVYVDNVSNSGTATHEMVFSGCVFNANVSNVEAGAIFGYMNPAETDSVMTVDACTFCGNRMLGSSGGAVYTLNDTFTMTNSTFSGNWSAGNSGAIRLDNTTSTVTNCTFQSNHGSIGGAIGKFSGLLTLQSVTVAQNTSDTFSGGIFVSTAAANITINDSIFADNTGVNAFVGWQTNVTIPNGGGNVQWPAAGAQPNLVLTTSGTASGNPNLNPLAANGGPTYTMSLGVGSAAINAGSGGGPSTDQRGVGRAATFDAGAYEN